MNIKEEIDEKYYLTYLRLLAAFGDKDVALTPQESNQYVGLIDTKNEWRLVTIDLTGKTLKTSGDIFAVKVGSGAKYDLHIDNFKID